MGWSSGSDLFNAIISAIKPRLGEDERKAIYLELIPVFENQDWDTQDECFDNDHVFEAAYRITMTERTYLEEITRGTCEDSRIKNAGITVCGSNGDRDWHWRDAAGTWHDKYHSEEAAVRAALRAIPHGECANKEGK